MQISGVLDKLLGGSARTRLLRFFLLNPDVTFLPQIVANKTKVRGPVLRRELSMLKSIGFVKKSNNGLHLSRSFQFITPLRELLLSIEPFRDDEIISKFKKGGSIKCLVVSGIFTKNSTGRVDVLLVGDRLKRGKLERSLRDMESEIGRELSYAIFDTPEFKYRLEVYDKFIRDIFDYPHRVLLDKIGVV